MMAKTFFALAGFLRIAVITVLMLIGAVSYTHLDVYKRQLQQCAAGFGVMKQSKR